MSSPLAYVRQDVQRPRLGSTADGIYLMEIKDGRDGGTQESIDLYDAYQESPPMLQKKLAVFSFTG
jgi:hypothetical protein